MMARRKPGSDRRAEARHLAHKPARKIADVRADRQHQVSHDLSTQAGTVVVEDLSTKGMSAKGGSRKRGLGGGDSCYGLAGALGTDSSHKVARLGSPPKAGSLDGGTDSSGRLVTVPAAYTGQRCHQCGHVAAENRPMQARSACVSCGHEADADHNAASTRRVRPYIAKNGFSGSGRLPDGDLSGSENPLLERSR